MSFENALNSIIFKVIGKYVRDDVVYIQTDLKASVTIIKV